MRALIQVFSFLSLYITFAAAGCRSRCGARDQAKPQEQSREQGQIRIEFYDDLSGSKRQSALGPPGAYDLDNDQARVVAARGSPFAVPLWSTNLGYFGTALFTSIPTTGDYEVTLNIDVGHLQTKFDGNGLTIDTLDADMTIYQPAPADEKERGSMIYPVDQRGTFHWAIDNARTGMRNYFQITKARYRLNHVLRHEYLMVMFLWSLHHRFQVPPRRPGNGANGPGGLALGSTARSPDELSTKSVNYATPFDIS